MPPPPNTTRWCWRKNSSTAPNSPSASSATRALPLIRLEPAKDKAFYDFEAKYLRNDTQYHCPAGLPDADEQALRQLALDAFRLVGGRGWGRVDVMRDRHGNPYLLEMNTSPGMTDHSLVPMAARVAGLDFDALCLAILEQTLA